MESNNKIHNLPEPHLKKDYLIIHLSLCESFIEKECACVHVQRGVYWNWSWVSREQGQLCSSTGGGVSVLVADEVGGRTQQRLSS
jgi:hypothetical protein